MYSVEEREIRRKKISTMVRLYYDRIPFLQHENLDLLIENTLDKYLNTNLTIEEINDCLSVMVSDRKNELKRMLDEEPKNEKKGKIKVKNKSDNEEGFVSSMIVTTLALITFSLSCIGLIIILLMKL